MPLLPAPRKQRWEDFCIKGQAGLNIEFQNKIVKILLKVLFKKEAEGC